MTETSKAALSIVIPTFNEEQNHYFTQALEDLRKVDHIEIIVADGGSKDATVDIAQRYGAKSIQIASNSRASRINEGVKIAQGKMILLHHPRSSVQAEGIKELIKLSSREKIWGGFNHCFDYSHPLLKFTSWYSNKVRPRLGQILYLDHCIFLSEDLKDSIFPIEEVDIFEDTILSKKLSEIAGRPVILPFQSLTSAIRFKNNGIIKQALKNQYLKVLYHLNISHQKMNKIYENKTALNAHYEVDEQLAPPSTQNSAQNR
jgi:glycosyltransferase involved in cell wall biosynthesis